MSWLACCNADGSEKLPLMIIGNEERSHAFKKRSGRDMGFDYHWNKKGWMKAEIFFEWLRRLDRYIGRETERKILSLIHI